MNDIKVGETRRWRFDTNNESFIVGEYTGEHYEEQYFVIQYTTDGRKQTKTKKELCDKSIIVSNN